MTPADYEALAKRLERAKKVDTLEERLREFRNAQKPLPADFAKVLNDNLWDLYRSEEKPE
jgi:hypothetical protein